MTSAASDAPAFELRGVLLDRPGVGRVLAGIDLSIALHRVTAIAGPSGSGKTSLLRLLNRLDSPTAGEIRYRGVPISEYPVRELRRRIGYVFQAPVLFPGTVRDNLRIAAELAGLSAAETDPALRDALAAAELEPALLDRPGERLSGGEAQRVTIARALVSSPESLLLDEPTSALDSGTSDRLMGTILRANRQRGLTVVMVSHRLEEAERVADAVVVLEQGRLAGTRAAEVRPGRAEVKRPRAHPD